MCLLTAPTLSQVGRRWIHAYNPSLHWGIPFVWYCLWICIVQKHVVDACSQVLHSLHCFFTYDAHHHSLVNFFGPMGWNIGPQELLVPLLELIEAPDPTARTRCQMSEQDERVGSMILHSKKRKRKKTLAEALRKLHNTDDSDESVQCCT